MTDKAIEALDKMRVIADAFADVNFREEYRDEKRDEYFGLIDTIREALTTLRDNQGCAVVTVEECEVCSGLGTVATTEKDNNGDNIEMFCPRCDVQQAINRTHFDLMCGSTLTAEQKRYLQKVLTAAQASKRVSDALVQSFIALKRNGMLKEKSGTLIITDPPVTPTTPEKGEG